MKFYQLSGNHLSGSLTRQTWRIMKLTFIILTAFLMQVSAATLAQQLTLKQDRITLKNVFTEIRKQTGYVVLYQAEELDATKTISLNLDHASLKEAMNKILEDRNLDFTIEDQSIVIKKKDASFIDDLKNKIKAELVQVTVTGKVQDETGQPMHGVTVKQKGTDNAVVTDIKGVYSITVTDNSSIIAFSFIGFVTQELAAKDLPNGSVIVLKASIENLKEVVVSKGYYNEKTRFSTGDVSVVGAKEIEEQPVSDPMAALEGRVPGLIIGQTSGVPGAGLNIQLRGQNSIASGNNPFYIVDGVPFTSTSLTSNEIGGGAISNTIAYGMSPFNVLNPSDIETIEVLKDADATTIYGSRGANGVILITTKKGKAGATKFEFNGYQGFSKVANKLHLFDTEQYLAIRNETLKNDNLTPSANDYDINGIWDKTRYTDWQKVLTGNSASFSNMHGSLSGGNANTQFLISGDYGKQGTVYPGNYDDQKTSTHISLTHGSTNQKFHANFSADYIYDNSDLPGNDLNQFTTYAPDAPPIYKADGSLNWQNSTWYNPLAELQQHASAVSKNLISNLMLSYQIIDGLNIKSSFGYTNYQMDQSNIIPLTYYDPVVGNAPSLRQNSFASTSVNTWIVEPQISYSRNFGNGKLEILVGTTYQQNIQSSLSQIASGFSSDALIPDIAAASTILAIGDHYNKYHYDALYSRINYILEDKYIINITARRDGSSRFGPGKQFGNFGAIGAGWIFSDESFIKNNLTFLSFGKLRASYGLTGNDQIGDYQFLSTYTSGTLPYQGVNGLSPTGLTNPNFAWEVVKKLEFGLDLGFFDDRIFMNVSAYRNTTNNQLVPYPLPSLTGFPSVQANLPATVQNTGLEFAVNTSNIKSKDFNWRTTFNLSFPRNKLVAYPNLASSPYAYTYSIGQSLFIKYLPHVTGVNPTTGIYTYEDVNKDGQITYPDDYLFNKEIAQKYYGGLANNFSYKGFQLDVFFQFVKQTGYNYLALFNNLPGSFNAFNPDEQNLPTYFSGRWQNAGDQSDIQKFTTLGRRAMDNSISDASFIRLKNLSFSYTLPLGFQKKLHLQNGRIYIQGQNLLTFTRYKGLDPETQSLALPTLRTLTAGIQFSL